MNPLFAVLIFWPLASIALALFLGRAMHLCETNETRRAPRKTNA